MKRTAHIERTKKTPPSPAVAIGHARKTLPPWIYVLGLATAVFLAYGTVWSAGFIWDDDAHVTLNRCIIGPLGLKDVWTSAEANYFPLVLTHLWVLHKIWGLVPLPYHLMTVLLHVLCGITLWAVLKKMRIPGAAIGAALWTLHPVQVDSVAWISEIKNTQSGLFFLLAIWFFVRWNERREQVGLRARDYVFALLCALGAILSKPSTVMLPVALGLCAWWENKTWRLRDLWPLVPFLTISAIASGWTIWEQKFHSKALGSEWSQTLPERLIIAGQASWFYLGKLLWPQPLAFVYPRWSLNAGNPASYLPAVLAVAALLVLWWRREGKLRPLFFASLFYLALLFPVLGFFDVYYFRYSFVADHFQYLASMGPLVLLGAAFARIIDRNRLGIPRVTGLVSCGAIICLLSVLTWRHAQTYRDNSILWRTTIERNPACWLAHNNLGGILVKTDRMAEAITHFNEALRYKPDYAPALYNLGFALQKTGQPTEAVARYEAALRIDPAVPDGHASLGIALRDTGRSAEAADHFRQSLATEPDNVANLVNYALTLTDVSKFSEAIALYERALALDASFAGAYYNLAVALRQSGRLPEAIARYEQLLKLKPDYPDAQNNFANALADSGRLAEAVFHYEQALKQNPNDVLASNNWASALRRMGDLPAALARFEQTIRLAPTFAEAHYNLALTLRDAGRTQEARAHYDQAKQLKPTLPDIRW